MNLNTLKTLLFSCILLYSFNFTYSAGNLDSTGVGVASGSSSTNPGQTSKTADGTATSTSANESSDQSPKSSPSTQDPNKKTVKLLEINIKKDDESSKGFQVRPMSRHTVYTSSEGFGFKSIFQGNNFIWKAESDEKYSNAFVVAKKDNIKIHIQGESEKIIKYFHGFWLDESFFTSVDNSKKKAFVLDLDQENTNNQYDYTSTQGGKVKTFSVKDSHAIQQIRLLHSDFHCGRADRYIFKAKDQKFYARKVVVMPISSYKINLQVELFNGLKLKYYRPAWGSMWQCQGFYSPLSLKPTSVDINKQNSTNEIDCSKNGTTSIFTPKDGYGINSVKDVDTNGQLDQEIWSTEKKDEYATRVEVSGTGNDRVVTIHTGDKTKKFKKDNDNWKEQTEVDQTSGGGKTGTGGLTPPTNPEAEQGGGDGSQAKSAGQPAGQAARTGTAARTSGSANQQAGLAGTTSPKAGTQTSGSGAQTGGSQASTPKTQGAGSSANPSKPAGQQGGGSASGQAARTGSGTTGTGAGQSANQQAKSGGQSSPDKQAEPAKSSTPAQQQPDNSAAKTSGQGSQSSPTSGTNESGKTTSSDSSDKTRVTLDIKKTSGDIFSYSKNGQIATFIPKDNIVFNGVKTGTKEIWKTDKNDEYATKVVLDGKGQKKKTVTIHLPNEGKIVFHRPEKNKPWNKTEENLCLKELDADKHPKNVKLYTADSTDTTKTKELEITNYKVKQDPNKTDIFIYTFNDGVNCTKVDVDSAVVWTHDSSKHNGKHPKSIVYNTSPSITVNIESVSIQCKKEGNNWLCEEVNASLKELDKDKYPKELKLFVHDASDSSNPKELDRNLYKVLKGEGDNHRMFNYKLKDESKCTEIKCTIKKKDPNDSTKDKEEDSTVWKQDQNSSNLHPKAIYLLDLGGIIFIEFSDDSFHFYRRSTGQTDWKLDKLSNISQIDKKNIKIRSLQKNASIAELDPSEYEFRELGFAYEYVIKSGVKLENLSYSGTYIYQYSSTDDNATYATAIYLLSNKGCQVVYKNKTFYLPPD